MGENTAAKVRTIHVWGDPTVDWLWTRERDPRAGTYFWRPGGPGPSVRLSSQPGGVALITRLIRELAPPEVARVEGQTIAPRILDDPRSSEITTSWTEWQPYISPGQDKPAYRLSSWLECGTGRWDYAAHKGEGPRGRPDLLVLEDSGLGFRDAVDGWPDSLSGEAGPGLPEKIIVKLAQFGEGRPHPLFDRLVDLGLAPRTTIITAIQDLRSLPVRVGVSLSWERIFEDVTSAIYDKSCPFVNKRGDLAFERVIVTLGASGAVMAEADSTTLVFDRSGQEDDFVRLVGGQMMGYNTCVQAALAAGWAASPAETGWAEALRSGIELARFLHLRGYAAITRGGRDHLEFPATALAEAYRERDHSRGVRSKSLSARVWDLGVFVDSERLAARPDQRGRWTILEETVLENIGEKSLSAGRSAAVKAVCETAEQIATRGPRAALPNVPIETVGAWRSADRHEIEGVRSVNNAIQDYLRLRNPATPLSVAVFGPPGAGKSFAVKEIAKSLGLGKDAQLTFNLSQFQSAKELPIAFHRIRDLHLKGITPVVFWDEFDTPCEGRPLGWLRHFLAPMQDGEFSEEGRVHPLGGGIYVFAGATRHSFEEFRTGDTADDLAAKKPDFISRLRAYINVRGPNGDPDTVHDNLYVIRRAFLLNFYLEAAAPQAKKDGRFQVDPGVMDALLRVSSYRHGARSMESLVRMSSLAGKLKYELSSLPPEHIIRMHVNVDEFNDLIRFGPRETLRIGITGHIGLDPAELDRIEQGVEEAVGLITKRYPDHILTVFSPLAVGADRLVARVLLRKEGSRLIAILPLPVQEFLKDFGLSDDYTVDPVGSQLRHEFRYWLAERAVEVIQMPRAATRNEAYLRVNDLVVDHSDVMIAVWDGREAQGPAGTGAVVKKAIRARRPVYHVWAGNYKKEEDKRTKVAQPGRVRWINLPGQVAGVWSDEEP